jgi:hypothetical protein
MMNLSDNVFLIRFKALYEFYKAAMSNNMEPENIMNELARSLGISRMFLYGNLRYLDVFDYLNSDEKQINFTITFRGIKLIEKVTEGNVSYTDDNILNDSDQIIRLFLEGAEKYGN